MARFDWFAWHRNYRTDEWIHSLSEAERWAWVAFLSYANETDFVISKCSPTLLAPLLMVSPVTLESMLESAKSNGKILDNGVTLEVKNGTKYRPQDRSDSTNADRQAKHKAQKGGYYVEDISREQVWRDASGICFHCSEKISFENMELDHIIPVSKGGKHELSNVCCSCIKCNRVKGNKQSNKESQKNNAPCQDKDTNRDTYKDNNKIKIADSLSVGSPEPEPPPSPQFVEIVESWNRMATELGYRKIKLTLTDGRLKKLRTRIREPEFQFTEIMQAFRDNRPAITNAKGEWKPNFDWVIRDQTTYTRILEGEFASNSNNGKNPGMLTKREPAW